MRQIPGCFTIGAIRASCEGRRGDRARQVCARAKRESIQGGSERSRYRDEWPAAAHCARERQRRAWEIRLNRPAKEIPEAGVVIPFAFHSRASAATRPVRSRSARYTSDTWKSWSPPTPSNATRNALHGCLGRGTDATSRRGARTAHRAPQHARRDDRRREFSGCPASGRAHSIARRSLG